MDFILGYFCIIRMGAYVAAFQTQHQKANKVNSFQTPSASKYYYKFLCL